MTTVFTGLVPNIEVPKGNLLNFVFKDVDKWSNKTALECGVTGSTLSFAELQTLIGRWGYWLTQRSGVFTPRSSVVAFLCSPTVEYAVTLLGTMSAAGACFPQNTASVPSEISNQLHETSPSLVVVSEALADNLVKAFAVLGRTIPCVVIGRSDREVAGRYHDIVTDTSLPAMEPVELTGDETAVYFHTSGSTGLPKLVEHSHRNLAHVAAVLSHPHWNPTRPTTEYTQDRALLNRHFGLAFAFQRALLPGLTLGICLVVKDLDEDSLSQDLIRYKINQILVVPPTLSIVLRIAQTTPSILTHLTRITVSGAPIPEAVAEAIRAAAPSVLLQRGYGMTELLAVASDPVTGGKPGFTGQLLSDTEVKVLNVNTRQPLPAGREGVIFVKTPRTMLGYLNNSKATQEVLGSDGWFDTGDIGVVDEGFIKITDRERELIKAEGVLSVSPSELENALLEHPQVREACVVGALQPNTGLDCIWAFVSLFEGNSAKLGTSHHETKNDDGQVTEETIKQMIRSKFNYTKHLNEVVILEKLPKNRTGKIDRKLLKERAKSLQNII